MKEFLRVGGTHLEALEREEAIEKYREKNAIRDFCHRYLRDDLGKLNLVRELVLCRAAVRQPIIV